MTYTLIHEVDNKGTVISWIIFCACALLTIDIYKRHRAIKKRQNETGKKWLFQNNLDVMNGISIVMLPIHCYNSLRIVNWTNNKEIIASVLVVLYLIICFIMIKILPKKLEEEASKLYPEYNLYKKA